MHGDQAGDADVWAEAVELAGLPESRKISLFVHATLREWILTGRLEPGQTLSQLQLAQKLGVSRTPMREALRMLQEEGLIDAEPNRRPRVRGFDPAELDSLYAARILLESLTMSLTVPTMDGAAIAAADECLALMRERAHAEDFDGWHRAHLDFHGILAQGADEHLLTLVGSFAARGQRFIRIYQLSHPVTGWTVGIVEHEQILDAVRSRQYDVAVGRLIMHLARTALGVLVDVAPERDASAVRAALAMVRHFTSADIGAGGAKSLR